MVVFKTRDIVSESSLLVCLCSQLEGGLTQAFLSQWLSVPPPPPPPVCDGMVTAG